MDSLDQISFTFLVTLDRGKVREMSNRGEANKKQKNITSVSQSKDDCHESSGSTQKCFIKNKIVHECQMILSRGYRVIFTLNINGISILEKDVGPKSEIHIYQTFSAYSLDMPEMSKVGISFKKFKNRFNFKKKYRKMCTGGNDCHGYGNNSVLYADFALHLKTCADVFHCVVLYCIVLYCIFVALKTFHRPAISKNYLCLR